MRDPKRIDRVLETIKSIWEDHPDMRFTQLIMNVADGPTAYYIEDDRLIAEMDDYYNFARKGNWADR